MSPLPYFLTAGVAWLLAWVLQATSVPTSSPSHGEPFPFWSHCVTRSLSFPFGQGHDLFSHATTTTKPKRAPLGLAQDWSRHECMGPMGIIQESIGYSCSSPFLKATQTFYSSFGFATWLGLAVIAWGPPSRVHVFAHVARIPPLLRPCHVLRPRPWHLYHDFTYSLNYITQTNNLNFISLVNANTRHRYSTQIPKQSFYKYKARPRSSIEVLVP